MMLLIFELKYHMECVDNVTTSRLVPLPRQKNMFFCTLSKLLHVLSFCMCMLAGGEEHEN